jgi:hypothetical protein
VVVVVIDGSFQEGQEKDRGPVELAGGRARTTFLAALDGALDAAAGHERLVGRVAAAIDRVAVAVRGRDAVDPEAAGERVHPGAADEDVVATGRREGVGAGAAVQFGVHGLQEGERVGAAAAADPGDVEDLVALAGLAVVGTAGADRDVHAARAVRVEHDVALARADDAVGAVGGRQALVAVGTAVPADDVVALTRAERLGRRRAGEVVGEARADDRLGVRDVVVVRGPDRRRGRCPGGRSRLRWHRRSRRCPCRRRRGSRTKLRPAVRPPAYVSLPAWASIPTRTVVATSARSSRSPWRRTIAWPVATAQRTSKLVTAVQALMLSRSSTSSRMRTKPARRRRRACG